MKIILAIACAGTLLLAWQSPLFPVLKSTVLTGRQSGGFYLVPTHQLLKPWGEQTPIPGRPVDMTFDSSGRLLAVLNMRSILLLDGTSGALIREIKTKATSYAGLAFRPGTRELWASETSRTAGDLVISEVVRNGPGGSNPESYALQVIRCQPGSPSQTTARERSWRSAARIPWP